ncbi:hypothetical protein SSTU70S_05605 [Stutzerimonas stutzeri]
MAFAVKRAYGKGHDYLYAWCDQFGTACIGSRALALTFETREMAAKAAEKAQRVCVGYDGRPARGIVFSVASV